MGGSYATRSCWVFCVEGIYQVSTVSKVSSWFPAIVAMIIASPLDKILELVPIFATIEDLFYFIFKVVINFYRFRWGWVTTMNFISLPWRESIHMKDGMLSHRGW
jgi:hypothetical protein